MLLSTIKKSKFNCLLLSFLIFLVVSSCYERKTIPKGVCVSQITKNYWSKDITRVIDGLAKKHSFDSSIFSFIKTTGYSKSYALSYIKDSTFREELFSLFDTLKDEGLPVEEVVFSFLNSLPDFSDTNLYIDPQLPVELDIILSHAILSLKSWADWGMLDPSDFLSVYQSKRIKIVKSKNYLDSISELSIEKLFNTRKLSERYLALKQEYKKLLENNSQIKRKNNLPFEYTLLKGSYDKRIPDIREKLRELGFTLNQDTSTFFDTSLFRQILNWQKVKGLVSDGKIGAETYEMLFLSSYDKLDKLKAAMERERWLRQFKLGRRFVWVNLASAQVNLLAADSSVSFKVCSGRRPDKKTDMRTPQLVSYVNFVQACPFWRVPQSIAEKEIFPAVLKNPNYLKKNNYELVRGSEVVPDSVVKWRELNPKKLPFIFRQKTGVKNSLGLVKFNIINDKSIYMHDTPNKWAFRYPFRWVSHGCVRLEKPLEMARFLLALNKEKDKKITEIVYDEKKRTKSDTFGLDKPITIHMKKWIPVFFDYRTARYDTDKHKITYSFDVYGYDEKLINDMNLII